MDPVSVIQLGFAGTSVLVLGRLGFALARYVERRLSGSQDANQGAETGFGQLRTSAPFSVRN